MYNSVVIKVSKDTSKDFLRGSYKSNKLWGRYQELCLRESSHFLDKFE